MDKIKKLLILLMCITMLIPSGVAQAENTNTQGTTNTNTQEATSTSAPRIELANGESPTATYGQPVSIQIMVQNTGTKYAKNVRISPVVSSDPAVFPFEITEMNYEQLLDHLISPYDDSNPIANKRGVSFNFTTRNDVSSGTFKVDFKVTYTYEETNASGTVDVTGETVLPVYVKIVGNPENEGVEPGKEKPVSVPRVIISGFTTEPKDVKAGESFKLTLHIKNTSAKTSVNNLEFDLQAAVEGKDTETTSTAFLPVAGSSTIYVSSIPKGGTTDISIDMNAKADLAQKPYVINVSMKYEDAAVNQYTSESSVSIPVKQEARVEVSEPQVMPNSIDVGSESNIMFSVYNTGKTKLYNVSVKFKGDSVSGGDAFIGNIESGATGNVDVMLLGQAATMDDGIIKILVTYEDETGAQSVIEKEMTLYVNEMMMDEGFPEEMPEDMVPENQGGSPVLIGLIIAAVVVAVIVAVVIIIKRKKKKGEELEDEIS